MTGSSTRREFLQTSGGAVAALCFADATVARNSNDAWPMFGYDLANTAYRPTASGPVSAVGPEWEFDGAGGSILTAPAIADGVVYVGSRDGFLYAVDATTGEQRWQFETAGSIHSAPAVVDGRVYVGSTDGRMYAVHTDETQGMPGSEAWNFETGGEVIGSPTVFDRVTSTEQTAENGDGTDSSQLVVFGSRDHSVYAVDAENGSEVWAFETNSDIVSTPAVEIPPEGADTTGPTVFVGSTDSNLYAFDPDDGSVRWAVGFEEQLRSAPVVAGESVFVANFAGEVFSMGLDGEQQRWEFDTGRPVVGSPAVTDDYVIIGTRGGDVFALERETGVEHWQSSFDIQVNESPAVAGEHAYLCSERTIRCVDVGTGETVWNLDARELASPAIANERLYVGSGDSVFAIANDIEGELVGEPVDAEQPGPTGLERFRFLAWPLTAILAIAWFAGIVYVAKRLGLLDRIETAADEVGPSVTTESSQHGNDTGGTESGHVDPPTAVWDLVREDVISRADERDRTAVENLLVTKYVDRNTLESPVVAYEVESLRDEPVRVRLSEPLGTNDDVDGERPRGDSWTIEEDRIHFERVIEPNETLRTIVGRPDTDETFDLLANPTISIEPVTTAQD